MEKENNILIEYNGLEVYYTAPYLNGLDKEIKFKSLLISILIIGIIALIIIL